jgi:hypothetical protein
MAIVCIVLFLLFFFSFLSVVMFRIATLLLVVVVILFLWCFVLIFYLLFFLLLFLLLSLYFFFLFFFVCFFLLLLSVAMVLVVVVLVRFLCFSPLSFVLLSLLVAALQPYFCPLSDHIAPLNGLLFRDVPSLLGGKTFVLLSRQNRRITHSFSGLFQRRPALNTAPLNCDARACSSPQHGSCAMYTDHWLLALARVASRYASMQCTPDYPVHNAFQAQ